MAGAFVRHRGLIAFAAGGAMAEATLLSFVAPSARPLAPQVTALPPLAAYHDLRWLFAFNQPWLGFTGALVLLVVARSAVDAVLVMLAWPRETEPGIPRPRFLPSLLSCAVLTVLVGLVMSPVVTLMFGVALLPFSWPYLAAVPILLGTAVALSQGGVGQSWWRRLPPARIAAWVIATFGVLSLASALMTHLDTPGIVAVAGLAGIVDARAWYGLTAAAARGVVERPPHPWQWRAALWRIRRALRSRTNWVPVAPLAAVMVLVLVVGLARLAFTGTVRFASGTGDVVAGAVTGNGDDDARAAAVSGVGALSAASAPAGPSGPAGQLRGAVLVVAGFGSTCCHEREHPARRRTKPARAPVLLPGPERRRAADPVRPGRGEHVHPGARRPDGRAGGQAVPAGPHAGGHRGGERGHPRPVRDAGPASARADRVGGAAQSHRRARPGRVRGRHRARRRADHAERPGRRHVTVRPLGGAGADRVGERGRRQLLRHRQPRYRQALAGGHPARQRGHAARLLLAARTWSSSTPSTAACSATARCSRWSRPSWPAARSQTAIWPTWSASPSGTCAARLSSSRLLPPPGGCRTCTRPVQ